MELHSDTSSKDKMMHATNSDRDIEAGTKNNDSPPKKLACGPSARMKSFNTPIDNLVCQISDKTIEVSESNKKQVIQSLEKYADLGTNDVIATLTTNALIGLSTVSATQRLQTYGLNKLQSKPPVSIWERLFDQFTDHLMEKLGLFNGC